MKKVTVEALNDAKYIGLSIYTVVILCVIGIPVSIILQGQVDAGFLIASAILILATTTTLMLVFVPRSANVEAGHCQKHYFVETISHPTLNCTNKHILMTRCEGHCKKTSASPLITFKPILLDPFAYTCSSCKDRLSVMKAVRMVCVGDVAEVFASYRYIVRCGCEPCRVL
ncbi:PREDICTED: norrin-like [Priapulus caudatus]|uniref:Norrin-like n=1 Tax=Priapulus caudatus TaxID=37621 RepID=A0ABM1EJV2_PRICU|nr:PREDICTED: norrin-like [Priapulus caudatus]